MDIVMEVVVEFVVVVNNDSFVAYIAIAVDTFVVVVGFVVVALKPFAVAFVVVVEFVVVVVVKG